MAAAEGPPPIIFGNPEFGLTVLESFPRFFEVIGHTNDALTSLTDQGYEHMDTLQRTVLNLASYVGIAAAEAITLVGHGLGTGGMKILRGMLEGTINAEYLRLHPDELDNYNDWAWVEQRKHHEFMREHRPELYAQIPTETRDQTEREWDRVRIRFEYTDARGRVRIRESWTPLNLSERASRSGLIDPYRHIYPLASKLIHATISGLILHFVPEEDAHRLAAPPSLHYCGEALAGTHLCLISVTQTLSQSVQIEPEPPINEIENGFWYAWGEETSR